jgi:RNA polymerase sigma factor (sigma-70 family)
VLTQEEAMVRHGKLIHAFIQRQGGGDIPYEDALQAGRIGLWRAIRRYDPGRGFAFSTYAWIAIQRAIQHAAEEEEKLPQDLGMQALSGHGYTLELEAGMDQVWVEQALYELVGRLPWRLRRIIEGRYGLGNRGIEKLDELGDELGISGEWVRQLQQEALAWLRHPARSQRLRRLMDKNSARDYRQALRQNATWRRKQRGR